MKNAVVKRLLKGIRSFAGIKLVYLFGSRARGEGDDLSDYDLLIVVEDDHYYKGMSTDMRRSLETVDVAKDLVVARESTVARQGQVPGTIYHEALDEGVKVYASA